MFAQQASPSSFEPIERSVLSEKVARAITDGLLDGSLKPGDPLVENDLARLLGVSRSPIREALHELVRAGIVDKLPGRGARVRRWTRRDLEELFSIRALLEGHAAKLACEHASEQDIADLRAIVRKMDAASPKAQANALVDLDLSFHRRLWASTGNTLLNTTLEDLSDRVRLFLTLERRAGRSAKLAARHRPIVEAIAARDPQRAELVLHDHVNVPKVADDLERE